ncbi:MAG: ribosome maturation factor RimP [Gammaproteobacteria bacterium]|nr:ribosome maturation factor RimP [Gammaproteobacteria bacterium]
MKRSERQITELLEPTINALGLQLWGVEHIGQGKHSMLRVYIESENGIAIEDCERVSRQVSLVLDVEELISGEYTLEVSSPGSDRRLFSLDQFRQYLGSEVNIRLGTLLDGRRKLKGKLVGIADEDICIEEEGNEYRCPFDAIEKANIVF